MKKLVMMLVCMFAVHTMVMADNDADRGEPVAGEGADIYQDLF